MSGGSSSPVRLARAGRASAGQPRPRDSSARCRPARARRARRRRSGRVRPLRRHLQRARRRRLSSRDLVAGRARLTYLGVDDPQLVQGRAARVYDRAIAADPDNLDARARLGELFLDKYNGAEAKRTIAEALSRNGRLRTGAARRGAPARLRPRARRGLGAEARPGAGAGERARRACCGRAFVADVEDFAGRARARSSARSGRTRPTAARWRSRWRSRW